MKVIIITGEREGGKTHWLSKFFHLFTDKSKKAGGFLSPGRTNENGDKDFDLMDLSTGKTMPLASRCKKEGYIRLGRFYFNPGAFDFGNQIIDTALKEKCDILIMDEIGPVELNENAWHNALRKVCSEFNGTLFISVRKRLVEAVMEKFSFRNAEIVDITQAKSMHMEASSLSWDWIESKH